MRHYFWWAGDQLYVADDGSSYAACYRHVSELLEVGYIEISPATARAMGWPA